MTSSHVRGLRLAFTFVFAGTALLALLARPVRADEVEAAPPQEPPTVAPPAAPPPAPPADPQLAEARSIVAAAESLFAAGHLEAALAEYTRAYQTLANHPRQYWVLHNLALCNERLFRYDEAMRLYQEYLRRAPSGEPDRKVVESVVRALHSLLATLVIHSSTAADVWLDDRRIGKAPGRFLIPAGRHVIEIRAPLYEAERREIALQPGGGEALTFELRRLSTYQGPSRAYFWTAVGLTGASLVAGTTLGLMAVSSHEEGQARAGVSLDTGEIADRARHQAVAADVCFGAAVLFGATATVLYFVTDWSDTGERAVPERKAAARRVTRLGLGVRGVPGVTVASEF
ncbi:MAG TPA: tetratricopeptide repeat protein [Polyangiaceae bacterium]